ncbi:MAG: phage replisome organizer N-terminal domain-containing protein [Clostridia bacterium]|nr:phage replisome organizer N-terminal domain-containing protein [Clostridia bacterium]
MSKYNDTRFFWLQLKEDFFDEDAISWLEEQPNGKEYCLFYLKLCLKSLKTSGIMIRKVGEMLVPYDCKKLAEITNTEVDTVVVAMELLKQIGLIKVLDNGELYLTEVEKMIGSQSVGAFKKQQQRIQGRQVADICPPNIEIELEKELKIDKRDRIDYKQVADMYNEICISFPKCTCLSENRKKTIRARLNTYSLEDFKKVFELAEGSDFLKGKNNRDWSASFDWLLKDSNFAKVLDGNYNNKNTTPKSSDGLTDFDRKFLV